MNGFIRISNIIVLLYSGITTLIPLVMVIGGGDSSALMNFLGFLIFPIIFIISLIAQITKNQILQKIVSTIFIIGLLLLAYLLIGVNQAFGR